MPDYSKGKVYKLVSNQTDKVYIGSTIQPLAKRKGCHIATYKGYQEGKFKYVTSFEIIKYGDCDIVLLENVNCESKDQLHARERHYIESMDCVNKIIPTRTIKEYIADNAEKLKEIQKQYYAKNAEKFKEILKRYRANNADKIKEKQKRYRAKNADKIKEKQKRYRANNADKIKEKQKWYRANNAKKKGLREEQERKEIQEFEETGKAINGDLKESDQ